MTKVKTQYQYVQFSMDDWGVLWVVYHFIPALFHPPNLTHFIPPLELCSRREAYKMKSESECVCSIGEHGGRWWPSMSKAFPCAAPSCSEMVMKRYFMEEHHTSANFHEMVALALEDLTGQKLL